MRDFQCIEQVSTDTVQTVNYHLTTVSLPKFYYWSTKLGESEFLIKNRAKLFRTPGLFEYLLLLCVCVCVCVCVGFRLSQHIQTEYKFNFHHAAMLLASDENFSPRHFNSVMLCIQVTNVHSDEGAIQLWYNIKVKHTLFILATNNFFRANIS